MSGSTLERSLEILVANFDRLEEDLFLKKVGELAAVDRGGVATWLLRRLLAPGGTNLVQVRLLAAIAELRLEEATPVVVRFLQSERPVRVYRRGVRCLRQLATREAYKALVSLQQPAPPADRLQAVREELGELLANNRLLFCFDIFFRERSDAKRIDAAAKFLITQLPDDWLEDILPLTRSAHSQMRLAALHIFGRRVYGPALAELLNQLQQGALSVPGAQFKPFIEALASQAHFRGDPQRLAEQLKELGTGLAEPERTALEIQLARLHPARFLPPLLSRYGDLNYADRAELLSKLPADDPANCRDFMRHLLRHEDHPQLLAEAVRRLLAWGDFSFLFQVTAAERGGRRKSILEIVFDADPDGIEQHVTKLLRADEEDAILCQALAYVLKRDASGLVERVLEIFFSGVGGGVKQTIVRHLRHFPAPDLRHFLERALGDPAAMLPFANDLLIGLLPLLSGSQLQPALQEWLLNRLLVLMEEAAPAQLDPFVYFFERYRPKNRREGELIAGELKLAQQTVLRNGDDNRLAQKIHRLIGVLGRGRE